MNNENEQKSALQYFSERLKKYLADNGIKENVLAREIGVAPTTLSGYITMQHSPDLDLLKKVCDYLDLSTDYLLGRTDNPYRDPSTFSKTEKKMLGYYKKLSENRQYEALGEIRMIYKNELNENSGK